MPDIPASPLDPPSLPSRVIIFDRMNTTATDARSGHRRPGPGTGGAAVQVPGRLPLDMRPPRRGMDRHDNRDRGLGALQAVAELQLDLSTVMLLLWGLSMCSIGVTELRNTCLYLSYQYLSNNAGG